MSNLSNLFISQSFYGMVNLENSLEPLASASGDVELQDGLGENLGLRINAQTKEFTVENDFKVEGNVVHKGNQVISGSVTVRDDNAPMGGIILENNSGGGTVQILPGGDFITTFNEATMTGIDTYGGNTFSGSWGTMGDVGGAGIGIINSTLSGTNQETFIRHGASYKSFSSNPTTGVTIKGDTIELQPSSSTATSVEITGDITAETGSFGVINARLLHVTTESASVIFSSGSNVLGDDETDRQDLIGQVIVSGTLGVEGNSAFTGSLTVSNEISSSTLNGIGNVTSYSASVDSRLDALESDTGSQDGRLDNLENFTASQETLNGFYNSFTASNDNTSLNSYTSSQETINGFYNSFTSSQENINSGYNTFTSSYYIDSASFDLRLDQQEAFSSSLVTDFVTDAQFNPYTQSVDIRLNNLELETSSIDNRLDNIELTTSSLQVEIDGLSSLTGSYATTGSNVFDGSQQITGSVNGNVETLTITSETASLDCSLGNFFIISGSGNVHLTSTNIEPGQTITVRVLSSPSLVLTTDEQTIKFPVNLEYSNSVSSSYDLLSFVSFDNQSLFGVAVNTYNL